ncbi:glutathione transferase [Massilia sp. MB5]|uniref:glutathione transferase n=1 Tax=unclassified Massilia TaxID=2609279 RepID=UPI00067D1D37|nr:MULTISPECIES: glutathione transferase [unclassified Massilia]AKU23309.1 glutathione S-transferase [Massilia sp. NR 4-1]UMR31772.1 glutathione transferase [Massilia sp. MB5]
MSLKLYADSAFTSPYALSVFVALKEKSLSFELETVDLDAAANKKPAYRTQALTGRVPCLVHDGFALTESSAISEYLDEVFPAPGQRALYPAAPQERAVARQIQAWLRSDLPALRTERSTHTVFYQRAERPLSAAAQEDAERLLAAAERWIQGEYLFEDWSIADTDLAVMLSRLVMNGDPVPQKLKDYVARQWQRESVQEWLKRINR